MTEDRARGHADEATRPLTGRDRLVAAFRRPRARGQLTAAALLAVVGFGSVVQVQAHQRGDDYENMREEDLVQLLNSLASASERAENEIDELEQTRATLRSDTDSRQAALEEARERAQVLGILAGTLPAVGPGVVVTVEDPEGNVGIDQVLNAVQELRDAGAEAIEFDNSVRVVAQTALTDTEDGIAVDGVEVTAPYTIEVIGDPHTLEQALEFTGGFVEDVEGPAIEGEVSIEQRDTVEIASVVEPEQPDYLQPAEPE